jgi:hypothetical protein
MTNETNRKPNQSEKVGRGGQAVRDGKAQPDPSLSPENAGSTDNDSRRDQGDEKTGQIKRGPEDRVPEGGLDQNR